MCLWRHKSEKMGWEKAIPRMSLGSVSSRGGQFSKWRWERRLRQWRSGSLQTVRTSLEEVQVAGDLQVPRKQ